ncbi:EamA family transporter [Hyphobacterium sp. HN65]|uniref:EamA family transporter n=1 Tax=Hyphobacterium lacteum TaxID=3116575 RepID=A0ABU7LSA2_9PROT|nr:EamA family transporter [Hyphobacterium sp. HN65]MEE2526755.1 EamA family transporter [Hyphobacterium sp. HN65]
MSAELIGAAAMLASAFFHSFVGLLTKQAEDKLVFRSVLMLTAAIISAPALFLFPPPPPEAWRFLIAGMGIHFVFQMAMISAFQRGDMNLVYPVMRGAAPAMAGIAALVFLRESLGWVEIAGLTIATLAILGVSWPDSHRIPKAKALAFAFLAAGMTALYSVNDASGVRATGNAISYLAWFFLLTAWPITLASLVRRGRAWPAIARSELSRGIKAGLVGAASYAFALYALSIAAVAPMAAMRETSVIFGAILAAFVLKEPFGLRRIILAILLAAGLVLLQVG